ncbi:RHS repeat-associated core domain-containing protein [Myroides odoratus]
MDSQIGYYYYGARYYDPGTSIFLSVDPLAEKYPNFNPYVYTFNDPINHIDPDGRDGVRVIDSKNKTITIKATYYVQTEARSYFTTTGGRRELNGYSLRDVENMQSNYNNYLNNLNLNVSEGEYQGYSINFALEFKAGGSVEASQKSANSETFSGYSIGNSIARGNENTYSRFKSREVENADGTFTLSTIGGVTVGRKNITMNTSKDTRSNKIHEIFHTFGFDHPKGTGGDGGIMKYPPERPNQNDANKLGNSSFLPKVIQNENEKN